MVAQHWTDWRNQMDDDRIKVGARVRVFWGDCDDSSTTGVLVARPRDVGDTYSIRLVSGRLMEFMRFASMGERPEDE